jgi:NAD(P)-dependent dehydrogenase (short-subunit alcohol dehydrogenase family)
VTTTIRQVIGKLDADGPLFCPNSHFKCKRACWKAVPQNRQPGSQSRRQFWRHGLPKAATLFLSRQYALEYGSIGVRSNAVNADRIRSGLLNDEMIASRSRARGVSANEYMTGNLLGLEVTPDDVAQAFLHLALAERTTANVTTVDGGNIAAAMR